MEFSVESGSSGNQRLNFIRKEKPIEKNSFNFKVNLDFSFAKKNFT